MKAINESFLSNSPDSGLTRRLSSYRRGLLKGSAKRLFDDPAVSMLRKYALNLPFVDAELRYLDNLTDESGRPFCRSIGDYSDIELQLEFFKKTEKASFRWNRHFQTALRKVIERYSRAKLHVLYYLSTEDIYNAVTDWSTSAGWTGYLTGSFKKREHLSENLFQVYTEREAKAKREGSFNVPYVMGARTQGGGAYTSDGSHTGTCDHKKRAVFMADLYDVIAGRRHAGPLTEWLKSYPYSNIGKSDVWTQNWVIRQRQQGRWFMSLDYSKYDSTIPSWLIRAAFDVIRAAFIEYDAELLAVCEEDFINKNIITADGVIHVTHGNPSGNAFTAIVNGICNELMTETWLDMYQLTAEYNIMGDDNLIYLIGTEVTDELINDVSSYISHNFGIKVNAKKSNFGTWNDDPEYLSRYWTPQGAWRPLGEVIGLVAYPERFRKHKGKNSTPEWVTLYAYILAYPKSMRNLIDVPKFMLDWGANFKTIKWTKGLRDTLPYNVRLRVEELGLSDKSDYLTAIEESNRLRAA